MSSRSDGFFHRRARLLTLVAAAACVSAVAAPTAGSTAETAERANPKVIRVGDDFFSPSFARVPRGKTVKWVWSRRNESSHNVRLRRAPGGVVKRRFKSRSGRRGIRFARRLKKPGLYVFVCSFHAPEMRHKIRVRR